MLDVPYPAIFPILARVYLSDPVEGGKRDSISFNARPPEVGGQ